MRLLYLILIYTCLCGKIIIRELKEYFKRYRIFCKETRITKRQFCGGNPEMEQKEIADAIRAEDVWNEKTPDLTEKDKYQSSIFFPIGEPNPYGKFFVGQSYLANVSSEQVPIFNVTFEPGCRNNWHIHHAKSGGGQMLICVGGRGYYQEWGGDAVEMTPGKTINIPAGVKHRHGAAPDSWFSHLAIEVSGDETSTEWCEAVNEEDYGKLK